jgi:serine/threonine-protein kinase
VVSRRTPTPAAAPRPASGWLTSSDTISHGRFAPGALLEGRYRIIEMLGKGGMGEVYRADDLRLGQQIALKFLPEGLRSEPVRLAQFHNEVRTAREVSHPNVCRVHDIGEAEGLLYLSMEYVDGEDLASSLRRIGRFPEDKATEIARQVCAGLSAAHQRGVVHRDLKPANIMLDSAGRVRIMDFGLAAVGRVEDVRAGTPAYMAPEQLLGKEVSHRSDIFALGLVMYELFTGKRAFTATTIGELVSQHETRTLTPPSEIVSTMDLSIERAILRCLDPEPERRPASALAVAAALPGGDPLAAALAAGETPSPDMVAAAGEGAGLSRAAAWTMLVGTLAGIAAMFMMAVRSGPLDRIRPEYSRDVLAQKARDALGRLGYPERPRDEAFGYRWKDELIEHVRVSDAPAPRWNDVLAQRPSALSFWYRRSPEPLGGLMFHSDLLTPGIVDPSDPPPTTSGMVQIELDHRGLLTLFEAIPPQRQDSPTDPVPLDWTPLFQLAGLDEQQLQPSPPLWNWLASTDTRAAWTGVWPESGREMRVEAGARGGRPVAFTVIGPWQSPWRMPDDEDGEATPYATLLIMMALFILIGAAVLARRNLRDGKGDLRGGARLAMGVTTVLLLLWLCKVHLSASIVFFASFLVAVCTSVFYGVLLLTIYLALEPFVRRHWPQVLVSWTNLLSGGVTDPVVGRDLLIGVALGLWHTVLVWIIRAMSSFGSQPESPGDIETLLGLRSTVGVVLEEAPYAVRNALLYFFFLFVLRVVLRRQWPAVLAFTVFFAILNGLGNVDPWLGALLGFLYFGSSAVVILRWGLLPFTIGVFVMSLLFDLPATFDTSAWFFGNMVFLLAILVALTVWGFYTSVGGRSWSAEPSR